MLSKEAVIAKLLYLKSKVAKDAMRKYLYISWPFLDSQKFSGFCFLTDIKPKRKL